MIQFIQHTVALLQRRLINENKHIKGNILHKKHLLHTFIINTGL